jgi:hypothetical protein
VVEGERTHTPDRADQREARQPELPGPLASDARRAHARTDADPASGGGGVTDVDADAGNVDDEQRGREIRHLAH